MRLGRSASILKWWAAVAVLGCGADAERGPAAPASGGAGTTGSGGTSASGNGGQSGNAGSVSGGQGGAAGQGGGTGGASGSGSGAGSGGASGAAGAGGSSAAAGTSGSGGGGSGECGTFAWACWPMPSSPETGLPNPAAYTDLGDDTVQDDVTGLVWQKGVASGLTWTDALAYCETLDVAGGGFRLPRRIELLSIVDHAEFSPTIDEAAFPDTPSGFFWTATPWAVSAMPPRSWIVNFADGLTSNNGFQTGEYSVRCVRGGPSDGDPTSAAPPPNLYSSPAPGVVLDRFTRLTWQQATSSSPMSFAAAEEHCTALDLSGGGWRLPSVNELSTLVDETRVAPAIQIATFADTPADDWYWSATPYANNAENRWCLNYNDGYTTRGRAATEQSFVRCVR